MSKVIYKRWNLKKGGLATGRDVALYCEAYCNEICKRGGNFDYYCIPLTRKEWEKLHDYTNCNSEYRTGTYMSGRKTFSHHSYCDIEIWIFDEE